MAWLLAAVIMGLENKVTTLQATKHYVQNWTGQSQVTPLDLEELQNSLITSQSPSGRKEMLLQTWQKHATFMQIVNNENCNREKPL